MVTFSTSPFQKYRAIRCLNHERVSDGQNMQIDQCMSCTRFEPVFGQAYEIMNDLGANVAAVLDDCQMSYSDIKNYANLSRIEKFIPKREDGNFDLTKVLERSDQTDPEFESGGHVAWGKGLAMNWNPVPKEDQRCHINWRQSINDDGSSLTRLSSFPKDADSSTSLSFSGGGTGSGNGAGSSNNKIELNFQAMEKGQEGCEGWITTGKGAASSPDTVATSLMNGGKMDAIKNACKGKGMDTLLIACMMEASGKTAESLVEDYVNMKGTVGDNPATICSAISCGVNAIIGYDKIPPIEKYGEEPPKADKGSKAGSSDSSKSTKKYPKIDKANRDNWLWTEFALALEENAKLNGKKSEDVAFFPKVVYLYKALAKYIKNSQYDGDDWGFPFTDEDLDSTNGVAYTSPKGPRDGPNGKYHYGIDMGANAGTVFRACKDGTVSDAGESWDPDHHVIIIDHPDGTYCRYMHGDILVQTGQQVSKGDPIGKVNGYGPSGAETYAAHLHIEMGDGPGNSGTKSSYDPISLWNNNGIAIGNEWTSTGIK